MRALTIMLMAVVLVLAACQSQPLFPENESASYEDIDIDIDDNVSGNIEDSVEDTVDVIDDVVDEAEEVVTTDYAATITATEGDLVELETRATDPDGDDVTITYGEPFGTDGKWQTTVGDAGEYEVDVVASDGKAETEATILLLLSPANSAPVIEGPSEMGVREGEEVDLGVFTITDPDGDEIITSYSGWMRASTYDTNYDDAGEHEVRIIAEDSEGNEAVTTVTIVVEDVNRAPELDIENRRITVTEGELVTIEASADDPDGDDVTITYEEPFDEEGEWQTEEGDAGEYTIIVTASDGDEEDDSNVYVTVEAANRPPVIEIDATITVEEGETIDLEVLADIEDPEGEDVEVTYSGWMTESTYTTTYADAGEYEVTITATDGSKTSSADVTIFVEDVNRPPVFIKPA